MSLCRGGQCRAAQDKSTQTEVDVNSAPDTAGPPAFFNRTLLLRWTGHRAAAHSKPPPVSPPAHVPKACLQVQHAPLAEDRAALPSR